MSAVIQNWICDALEENDKKTEDLAAFIYFLMQEEGIPLMRIARLMDNARKLKSCKDLDNELIAAAAIEQARDFLGDKVPDLRW